MSSNITTWRDALGVLKKVQFGGQSPVSRLSSFPKQGDGSGPFIMHCLQDSRKVCVSVLKSSLSCSDGCSLMSFSMEEELKYGEDHSGEICGDMWIMLIAPTTMSIALFIYCW